MVNVSKYAFATSDELTIGQVGKMNRTGFHSMAKTTNSSGQKNGEKTKINYNINYKFLKEEPRDVVSDYYKKLGFVIYYNTIL